MYRFRLRRLLFAAAFTVLLASPFLAQQRLTPADAKSHLGDQATVCGQVVSATYSTRSKGEPTFLNVDKTWPNVVFTVLIGGRIGGSSGNGRRSSRIGGSA